MKLELKTDIKTQTVLPNFTEERQNTAKQTPYFCME